MAKSLNEKLKEYIDGFIYPIDFKFELVGEYVFTNKDEKLPLCSGFELLIMFTNKSVNKFFGSPIDYESMKELVSRMRKGEIDVEVLE